MLFPFLSVAFLRAAASFGLRGGGRLVTADIERKAKTVPEFVRAAGIKNGSVVDEDNGTEKPCGIRKEQRLPRSHHVRNFVQLGADESFVVCDEIVHVAVAFFDEL